MSDEGEVKALLDEIQFLTNRNMEASLDFIEQQHRTIQAIRDLHQTYKGFRVVNEPMFVRLLSALGAILNESQQGSAKCPTQ